MKRKIIGTMVAGVLAVSATVFGTGSPALAASRSEKCVAWACGSATFTFDTNHLIINASLSIKDPLCNGSTSFLQFRVHYVDGSSSTSGKRYDKTNNEACDTLYDVYPATSFGPSSRIIKGAQVLVGDGINGVASGNIVDNPLS